jgi:hypothetical protein
MRVEGTGAADGLCVRTRTARSSAFISTHIACYLGLVDPSSE